MNELSIVMPCHNRGYDLLRVLQAYDQQTLTGSFELIAVDDASSDDTYSVLSSFHPQRYQLRIERLDVNQGPAGARNRGLDLVSAPLVLFVGDDILPSQRFVRAHLQLHKKFPQKEVAILGKTVWPVDFPVNHLMAHIDGVGAQQFSYHYLQEGQEYDFRHFYTSNISLKRDLIRSLDHWFDTDFPFAAFEDAELSYRLSQKGMRILYFSAPLAYHYHYHNVWTFSARQYKSGLMACVLIEKHPELSKMIKGRGWEVKLIGRGLASRLQPASLEQSEWLEAQVLYLASQYEEQLHRLLDPFYLRLWHYFYYKGLLEGSLSGETAKRISRYYTVKALTPLIAWFINESQRYQEVLPRGYGEWVLECINCHK